ncbi:hypothetical protein WH50_11255 [Pokkaliibacter plantistimulans]|uniref:Uncharacterized protein n=2 Tax=Pseudomonadota TaxID=1224 RepID=A0ABX5LX18_9GAMM|nr:MULTISPECIES: hypothetical protein [Pokkaliibacter]MDH2434916.1 hypothetical protein [Pokkaliibacter sp. MBI-7]PPC74159.1 hypothetical protein C4K68_27530 [Pokkaliibacter plantistimulans]PXF31204.1 hypothetical protein WH50_11255 [Pokkaliibacter plantistimulans]
MTKRVARDFYARDAEEQQAFLTQTWCNNCLEVDLGMTDPVEYEENGIVFVEGHCARCGTVVVTEIDDSEDE